MNKTSELLEDIRAGKMVILIDDEDRENEGDVIIAADFITPQAVNFMAVEARGLICLALAEKQIIQLGLPLMVQDGSNYSPNKTAFTVSIEASHGVSTGISAADRCQTIRVASNPMAKPSDIITPGHIFPIRAQEGGVLKRAGHTEASVDLAKLAGLNSAAVICEIMNPDGTMARTADLIKFAQKHNLKIGTIEDLIEYRIEHDTFVEEVGRCYLPTEYGEGFEAIIFKNHLDKKDHLAIIKGNIRGDEATLVRVHSECLLGDVFGSLRTRSGSFLKASLEKVNEEGTGVIVYIRQEDMDDRLVERIKTYAAIDNGETDKQDSPIFRSDKKDYGVGAQILRALGLKKIKLLTNSPSKRVGLKGYGIEIVDTVALTSDRKKNMKVKESSASMH